MNDSVGTASNTRASKRVECGAPSAGQPSSPDQRTVGRHRRDGVFEDEEDFRFVVLVHAAAAAAFHEAAGQPPQQAYLALAHGLSTRGINPDPAAIFDAAMLISRGRPPALLRQEGRGRHQLHDPAQG